MAESIFNLDDSGTPFYSTSFQICTRISRYILGRVPRPGFSTAIASRSHNGVAGGRISSDIGLTLFEPEFEEEFAFLELAQGVNPN